MTCLGDKVVAASGGVMQWRPALGVSNVDVSLFEEKILRDVTAVVPAGQM